MPHSARHRGCRWSTLHYHANHKHDQGDEKLPCQYPEPPVRACCAANTGDPPSVPAEYCPYWVVDRAARLGGPAALYGRPVNQEGQATSASFTGLVSTRCGRPIPFVLFCYSFTIITIESDTNGVQTTRCCKDRCALSTEIIYTSAFH